MKPTLRSILVALLALVVASCGEQESSLKFGAKNFGESRILAQMMAALAEEQGLPVAGVVDYASTQAIMEALKRGDIDAYPEYNGTGLVMLGQNPIADGDASMARVKEIFEPLGLSWRARFGFADNYGLAMLPERAAELGVTTMSELVSQAGDLTLGIDSDFEVRPLDGFQPMARRYALEFANVDVVSLSERPKLYDNLLDEKADVIEVFTTDGQIADYGLVLLTDDLQFFPVYQAAPLVRSAALSSHKNLGPALDALAGKIDEDQMRDLNRKVDSEGRSPRAVARDALARMNLIKAGAVTTDDPLLIAASPQVSEGAAAADSLRATRKAFQGRDVQISPSYDPLGEVAAGAARLALVGADAFFDLSGPAPVRTEAYEAVAAVGQDLIHVVTLQVGPRSLADAKSIASGPAGSSSARIAGLLKSGLGLAGDLAPQEDGSAAGLTAKLRDKSVDVAIVFAPEGDAALVAAFGKGGLRLLPIEGWNQGANLVRYPFLREARMSGDDYKGQYSAVDTLGSQLVLAGPAPQTGDLVGDQGPSAIAVGLLPISGSAVADLNAAMDDASLIDPALRQAAALAPVLPSPPAAINPRADISIFNLLTVALFVWIIWLFIRPEYR